ncbi:hypothetical protein ACFQL7_06405 [Halocatena marina]|uniref:Uncharacterized protein n=1 Tax=Halocatena marina TaxID=2934937 RepID=A0ABD5YKU7_9EURY
MLDQLCDAIAQRDGMGQFLIRNAFETPLVQAIRSCFEIVVELRISTQGPEYRWHLQTTGFTTQWLRSEHRVVFLDSALRLLNGFTYWEKMKWKNTY